MNNISECLMQNVRRVAVVGHTNPDGDCVGSVTGLYQYLTENYPELEVVPYLEPLTRDIAFLSEGRPVRTDDGAGEGYDLVISLDAASADRIGAGKAAFFEASESGKTLVIDHHETNPGFGAVNHIEPFSSATCEVLTGLMDMDKISKETAESLYTGICTDSGVFRFDSTTPETLRRAALLIEKGIRFDKIIEQTVSDKDYEQLKVIGRIINDGVLIPEEHFFYALCSLETQRAYGLSPQELGPVVAELNHIREADAVLFLYQKDETRWKGSMRAKSDDVNVAEIANSFGGGGHRKAAGFEVIAVDEESLNRTIDRVREAVRNAREN